MNLTIATGVPALDQKIAEKYPQSVNVKTENELRSVQTQVVVWSSFLLAGQNNSEKKARLKQWLTFFRYENIQSVFLTPYEDWMTELRQEGFEGFVPITNNNVPLKRLFNTIDGLLQEPIQDASPSLTFLDDEGDEMDRIKKPTKVWAFWSAKPGMGVSTLVQSLAVELARAGHRTLLIEWDTVYQSVPYSLGLSDPKRCIEQWVTDAEAGLDPRLEDYLLNKTIWLQEHKDKGIKKAVEALPDHLYVLAPSNQIKPWDMMSFEITTVKKTLDRLTDLNFSVVLIDVPSEITHGATAATLQRADTAFVVVDGKGSHGMITKKGVDFIEKELDISFDLILNNVDDAAIKYIEKGMGKKSRFVLPYDGTLSDRSMRFNPIGGEEYQSVLLSFLTEQGYLEENRQKRKMFRKRKIERPVKKVKPRENKLVNFINFS
ncbi:AAA family ATPase [Novibacillus thermophilus]|uniref:AAA domain-containing protein n=1 Tax=Novibacillus thermophilus TaxID=1471761 RepID=A0A1U9K6M4_9BACL|nr:hypothetical protein [Novibacillus thermophilus]AQS55663.1 hypothetical protein B0W44_07555 [Novibacillus thermophilus]